MFMLCCSALLCFTHTCSYMTLEEAAERQVELAGRYEGLQRDLVAQVGRRVCCQHEVGGCDLVGARWVA